MYDLVGLNGGPTVHFNQELNDFKILIKKIEIFLDRNSLKLWWYSDENTIEIPHLDDPEIIVQISKRVPPSTSGLAQIKVSYINADEVRKSIQILVTAEDLAEVFYTLLDC